MTKDQIDSLLFRDWRDGLLAKVGKEAWLTVYQIGGETGNNHYGIYSAFVPSDALAETLEDSSWDFGTDSCGPGNTEASDELGRRTITYRRFQGIEGAEPIVLSRNFHGARPDYLEILEEFRLYHNLYEDRQQRKLLKISDSGLAEEVVRMTDKLVEVRLRELRQFAATKRMHIAFQFDLRRFAHGSVIELGPMERELEIRDEQSLLRYDFHVGDLPVSEGKVCSSIHGKKLIPPFPIERSGIGPYDTKEDEEIEFIIGTNDFGKSVSFTSREDKLANFFGANKGAPQYVTPVFFRKEVLSRYFLNSDLYLIEDGYLRCGGLWGVRIDNDHPDCVMVLLGDLGRDLPLDERKYWRTFNIAPDGRKMSDANFKRSLMVEDVEPREPDHRFQSEYDQFLSTSSHGSGWPVLLPLGAGDSHLLTVLHVPVTETQAEFDQQVLGLTKTIIDSLNVAELKRILDSAADKPSISLLEEACERFAVQGFQTHVQFLRDLQDLRSSGVSHRKGRNYDKAAKKFGVSEKTLPSVFRDILEQAISFLIWLRTTFIVAVVL